MDDPGELLAQFDHLDGLTLGDMCRVSRVNEDKHMLPVVMRMLKAIKSALPECCIGVLDSHATGALRDPHSKPDACFLADGEVAAWSTLLNPVELKLVAGMNMINTAYGQQSQRSQGVLKHQPRRHRVLAPIFTMNTIEVHNSHSVNSRAAAHQQSTAAWVSACQAVYDSSAQHHVKYALVAACAV